MSLKKSPLFLLALFIFGTSSLLLGIPMEGDHLLRRQKSNPLTVEPARRDYESSRQDERIDDRSGVMESSSFARGASPHIAETPNNTKLGSADGDPAIELSPSLGRLGQHEVTATDSHIEPKSVNEKMLK